MKYPSEPIPPISEPMGHEQLMQMAPDAHDNVILRVRVPYDA